MSKLVHLPNPRQVKEEAAQWLVCIEEGLSETERRSLQEWLQAHPANGKALVRMAKHWDAFDELAELADVFPLPKSGSARMRTSVLQVARIAASIIVVVTGLYLAVAWNRTDTAEVAGVVAPRAAVPVDAAQPSTAGVQPLYAEQLQTAVGKQSTNPLPDGSVITLNTNTILDVEYSATERLVVLTRGEANFSVAHDPARPFRVRAGVRVVQAVGTVFNVRRGARDDVRVTVANGIVKVSSRAIEPSAGGSVESERRELLVNAGEFAVVGEQGAEVHRLDAAQLEASQAWQHGALIYQGETLDVVLADVSRYTTVRFSIADDSIRTKRVGGVFRAGDVDGLLLALRESFDIEPHREGDVIVLTSRH